MDKTKLFLAVMMAMLASITSLSALDNYLNVMTFMQGEFAGSEFGESIASLDFNGDGYMDLVVSSGTWNPTLVYADQNRWGKLYFYWGGPNFDNIADFVIPGSYNWQMGPYASIFNAGDMNGDEIDDLILDQRSATYDNHAAVFLGNSNPQTTPDVLLTYPYSDYGYLAISTLGDINGDNRDDVAFTMYNRLNSTWVVYIWDDITAQPVPLTSTLNGQKPTRLCGIGDVNNDGYDDCMLNIPINPTGETHNKLVLYYGSANFPVTDSLVIYEDSNSNIKSWSCPTGDVNGDGVADFTAGSQLYDYAQHLWLGGNNLTPQWDIDLSATLLTYQNMITERGTGYPFVHGDLNGDGYQDVLGFDSEAGYYSGFLYLWMGSPNMNGSMDYLRLGMDGYDNMNYGWSKVTGDFNADGYCDVAVGAPWWGPLSHHNSTGRVFILAGNADLHETTVANEDDTVPAIALNPWQFEAYPNPLSSQQIRLNIHFKGAAYRSAKNLILGVYNLKGQKLHTQSIPADKLQEGIWEMETTGLGKGILLLSISQNGTKLITKKVTSY